MKDVARYDGFNGRLASCFTASALLISGVAANAQDKANVEQKVKLDELTIQQKVYRKSLEIEAESHFREALELRLAHKYEESLKSFAQAIDILGQQESTAPSFVKRKEAITLEVVKTHDLFAEYLLKAVEKDLDSKKYTQAIVQLNKVKALSPKKGSEIDKRIASLEELEQKVVYKQIVSKEAIEEEVAERDLNIKISLDKAQIFYDQGDYDQAKRFVQQVFILDYSHKNAHRLARRIEDRLGEVARRRRDVKRLKTRSETAWKWADSIKGGFHEAESVVATEVLVEGDQSKSAILKKMQIVLPKIKFTDTDVQTVISYLKRRTRDLDPELTGLNLVFYQQGQVVAAEEFADDEEGLDDDLDVDLGEEESTGGKKVSLEFEKIPVSEVIRYICEQAGLTYSIRENAVIITDADSAPGVDLETDFYPVSSSFRVALGLEGGGDDSDEDEDYDEDEEDEEEGDDEEGDDEEEGDGGDGGEESGDDDPVKRKFATFGVEFPPGASVRYLSNISRLVVTNTPKNLERIREVIKELNIPHKQISIETKFAELTSVDIEELGFSWFHKGNSSLQRSSSNRLRAEASTNSTNLLPTNEFSSILSAGQRTIGESGLSLPGLDLDSYNIADGTGSLPNSGNLEIDSVIGDVALNTIIRAISQENNLDVLTAPKITTQSGETAKIRVVQERWFPEEFEAPDILEGTLVGSPPIVTPVHPTFGEARDLGVSLEVTPTVDPDGYTIQLELKPKVEEFIKYDSTFNAKSTQTVLEANPFFGLIPGADETITSTIELDFKYSKPIISSRTVETEVTVWDGESVVVGGLVNEKIRSFNDSVPVISDIPLLGRLFRSKGEVSQKSNLLIFVTARLVNPAGEAINKTKLRGLPQFNQF